MTKPKVVRRPVRFGSAPPPDHQVRKHSRSDPNWHITLWNDTDYIRADQWDKWVAVAIGIVVLNAHP